MKLSHLVIVGSVAVVIAGGLLLLNRSDRVVRMPQAEEQGAASDAPIASSKPSAHVNRDASVVPPGEDPDTWYLSQSDDVKASMIMGFGTNFGGQGSLAGLLLNLEHRIASGDESAVMPAAELIRTCSLLSEITEAESNRDHPSYLSRKACQTLPDRPSGYDRTIVAEAALRGSRDAILNEWGYTPLDVAYSKDVAVRQNWASGVAQRLELLSERGDLDARIALARVYLAEDFGVRDYGLAAKNYRAFLNSAPASDPRRKSASDYLSKMCMLASFPESERKACD
jgi:hypothetical protein